MNTTAEGRISTKIERLKKLIDSRGRISSQPPTSETYTSNNRKEKICLEICHDFKRRVSNSFPDLLERVYLSAKNEFGVEKCVCTTLRPQILPYPSLHDIRPCAEFVARFFDFEPLIEMNTPPDIMPSPTQTIQWGVGDPFDLATVLTSLLLGAGYDAYVVYGKAPDWICTKDESLSECLVPCLQLESAGNVSDDTATQRSATVRKEKLETNDDIDESPNKLTCEERIHCWVLVKPGRRNVDALFVEPSTGRVHRADNTSPYVCVFSLWNPNNYWVRKSDVKGILSVDLTTDEWEAVFRTTEHHGLNVGCNKSVRVQNGRNIEVKPFDVPCTWVERLIISEEEYNLKYPPSGYRVILYHKAKLELFSKKGNRQGLLCRVTEFHDVNRIEPVTCTEYFDKDRSDCLLKRTKQPFSMHYYEAFSPQNPLSLQDWTELLGLQRTIRFFPYCRPDGLICRKDIFGKETVEDFIGRSDNLVRRTLILQQQAKGNKGEPAIFIAASDDSCSTIVKIM